MKNTDRKPNPLLGYILLDCGAVTMPSGFWGWLSRQGGEDHE